MNVKDAILTRRSVRKYKQEPVKEEALKVILEAARQAPSAGNKQPWEFIVVTDPEIEKTVGETARYFGQAAWPQGTRFRDALR